MKVLPIALDVPETSSAIGSAQVSARSAASSVPRPPGGPPPARSSRPTPTGTGSKSLKEALAETSGSATSESAAPPRTRSPKPSGTGSKSLKEALAETSGSATSEPSAPPRTRSPKPYGTGSKPLKEAFAEYVSSAATESSADARSAAAASADQTGYPEASERKPTPPLHPPNRRNFSGTGGSRPDAKDSLRNASRAMAEITTAPFVRSDAMPRVIGASVDAGSAGVKPRREVEEVFRRIGGGSAFTRLGLLGAVASDPKVAAYVVPNVPVSSSMVAMMDHAGRIFQTISCGKQRIAYGDLVSYFKSDAVLYRVWDRLRKGSIRVSKVQFQEVLDKDLGLSSLMLSRSITEDEEHATMSGEKTMASRLAFCEMAGKQGTAGYDEFAASMRSGTRIQNLYALIDTDREGSVNKIEFLGAVASSPRVAAVLLMDFFADFVATTPAQANAAEVLFNRISGGSSRVSLDDFLRYYSPPQQPAMLQDVAGRPGTELANLPGGHEEEPDQLALLGGALANRRMENVPTQQSDEESEQGGDHELLAIQSRASSSWETAQRWMALPGAFIRSKISPMWHPLDGDLVQLADLEAKTCVWGREPPLDTKTIVYENEYDHAPVFCTVISIVQLFFYLGDVGFSHAAWAGPVSGPQTLWMMVYDVRCEDQRDDVWRLWTYQWSHASLVHVLGNCFGNLVIGGLLEAVHGTKAVASLYTCGVITGALTMGTMQPHRPVVGSSGGVYTMVGARVCNLILNKENMPHTFWFRFFMLLGFLLFDTVTFFTSYSDGTSYAAHLGGWICGLLLGGHWLENFNERPFELKLVKWFKRAFASYILFCLLWYMTQESGNAQGLFESAGHCRYRT